MSYWPLTLIKRLAKGQKITPAEEDQNKTDVEEAVNALKNFFNVALNPDGTLKDNTVSTNAIQDRAVTLRKLAFLSSFYAVDAGAVNAMAISFTPAAAAYAAGMVFFVKVLATNTGPATLNVDGLGAVAVKQVKSGALADVDAGNLVGSGVYCFVHDGTQFWVLNPTPIQTLRSFVQTDDASTLSARITAAVNVTFAHGFSGAPNVMMWTIVSTAADGAIPEGTELDVTGLWCEGALPDYEPAVTPFMTASLVGCGFPPDEGVSVIANYGGVEKVLNTTLWKLRVRAYLFA